MTTYRTIVGKIDMLSNCDAELFFKRTGWEVQFVLRPWRLVGEAIQSEPLRATISNLDRETAQTVTAANAIGSIIRLTTAIMPEDAERQSEVDIHSLEGDTEDSELARFELPRVIRPPYLHPRLGEFCKIRDLACYEGRATWNGHIIQLTLEGDEASLSSAAKQAEAMLENDRLWHSEFEDRIYSDLFSLWNETWRDGSAIVSREEWLGRIVPQSLSIAADGSFLTYYGDGDLFAGHWIEVSGSLATGASHAGIVG